MTSMSPSLSDLVRINGGVKLENQRMDGAIAITHTPTGLVARCVLRDLEREQVVVDVQVSAPSASESREQQHRIQLVSWGFQ